ncbi:MAG: RsmB/NOP family class I SAM-dependent RNA methyltransferase [Candidatus Bathyarchaeia archaeon]
MSYILILRMVLEALRRLAQGSGEKEAFAESIKESKVRGMDASRAALKIFIEISKRKIRYDRLISTVEDSKASPHLRRIIYLFLYHVESCGGIEELCRFLKYLRGAFKVPSKVENIFGLLISHKAGAEASPDPRWEIEDKSLEFSLPPWFVEYCFKLLGRADGIRFMNSSLRSLPTYVRVNTLKGDEDSIIETLRSEGVELREVGLIPHVYKVERVSKPLVTLESWRKGYITIQDLLSCLVGHVANPRPYDRVLDLCAAPGGKTAMLAQMMDNKGEIYSLDLSPGRLRVWRKEMKRLGVRIAKPILSDARGWLPLKGEMDLVLLDPPCTGTGILMKNPSMKDRLSPSMLKYYARIQWSMLDAASKMVGEGGHLIYSTCSITREENEDIIWRLLKVDPSLEVVDLEFRGLPRGLFLKECIRLYPHINLCNGGFIAKLRRL